MHQKNHIKLTIGRGGQPSTVSLTINIRFFGQADLKARGDGSAFLALTINKCKDFVPDFH